MKQHGKVKSPLGQNKRLSYHSREPSATDTFPSTSNPRTPHKRTTSTNSVLASQGNPPVTGSTHSHKRTTSTASSQNSNFLADQYDRDRKAIITYCFTKPDHKTGAPPNNYITHVRIIEDARYPSQRPPPTSRIENKKKRILIVSSKPNAPNDVQLHKARENLDGSFQIGRTWDLRDLIRIERDSVVPEGFVFVMGKRYYWETNTAKERTVFIKSLVNIYMQALSGKVPELINWDLGMFYMDEKSYRRAVITGGSRRSSSNDNRLAGTATTTTTATATTTATSTPTPLGSPGADILPATASTSYITSTAPSHKAAAPVSPAVMEPPPRSRERLENYRTSGNTPTTMPTASNTQERGLLGKPFYSGSATTDTINQVANNNYVPEPQPQQQYETTKPSTSQPQVAQPPRIEVTQEGDAKIDGLQAPASTLPKIAQMAVYGKDSTLSKKPAEAPLSMEKRRAVPATEYVKVRQQQQSTSNVAKPVAVENDEQNLDLDMNRSHTPVSSSLTRTANVQPMERKEIEESEEEEEEEYFHDPIESPERHPRYVERAQDQYEQGEDLNEVIDLTSEHIVREKEEEEEEEEKVAEEEEEEDQYRNEDITTKYTEGQDTERPLGKIPSEGDLPFESRTDIRYTQLLQPDSPHKYHEVTTIEEEEQEPSSSLVSGLDNGDLVGLHRPGSQHAKKIVEVDDEALLEALTDINWELDDDVDEVLERLDLKLAQTEHTFNRGLVDLQSLKPHFDAYEKNVDVECDKMNPTLSLFLMEMNNFVDDIDFVESQDNGLQVESANKKMLWNTLSDLLNTVSLDEATLKELLKCPIRERNLPWMERQLDALFKAVKAITGETRDKDDSLQDMEALKRRRQYYERVTELFLERVVAEMGSMFAYIKTDSASDEQLISILQRLLTFSSLILFCKEISPESYSAIIDQWNKNVQPVYAKMWEKSIRDIESLCIAGRNNIGQGLASQPGVDNLLKQWKTYRETRKIVEDHPIYWSVLSNIIEMLNFLERQCIIYQNFVSNFFHISSTQSFSSYITKYQEPNSRIIDLETVKQMESDRASADAETHLVTKVFHTIISQIIAMFTDVMKTNQTIILPIFLVLEQKTRSLESSNQEYLFTAFKRMMAQQKQLWSEFVDDQLLAIDREAANISGRELIPAILELPVFIKNLQDALRFTERQIDVKSDAEPFETRTMANEAVVKFYDAIVSILSKNKSTGKVNSLQQVVLTPEGLNEACTLLINTNWLVELLSLVNLEANGLFDSSIQTCKTIFETERDLYADFLLHSYMPKLTSFVTGATLVVERSQDRTANPAMWGAYNKRNLSAILENYTSEEIKVMVAKLNERMLNDMASSQPGLMADVLTDKLWSCIQGQMVSLYLKLLTLIERYYKGIRCKFTKNDVITAFEKFKRSKPVME